MNMRRIICCLLALVAWKAQSVAQASYAVNLIPDSLKKDAHAVVRELQESFVVSSPAKATFKIHCAVTVLDEQGKDELEFEVYSNYFFKLDNAEIFVYDANGKQIQ